MAWSTSIIYFIVA